MTWSLSPTSFPPHPLCYGVESPSCFPPSTLASLEPPTSCAGKMADLEQSQARTLAKEEQDQGQPLWIWSWGRAGKPGGLHFSGPRVECFHLEPTIQPSSNLPGQYFWSHNLSFWNPGSTTDWGFEQWLLSLCLSFLIYVMWGSYGRHRVKCKCARETLSIESSRQSTLRNDSYWYCYWEHQKMSRVGQKQWKYNDIHVP